MECTINSSCMGGTNHHEQMCRRRCRRKRCTSRDNGLNVAVALSLLVILQLSSETISVSATTSSSQLPSTPSIPRSTNSRSIYLENVDGGDSDSDADGKKRRPPWNLSPNIDEEGFFISKYKRKHGEWEHGIIEYEDDDDDDDNEVDMNGDADGGIQLEDKHTTHSNEGDTTIQHEAPPIPLIGGKYHCLDEPVYIRQVPGDGNCLFHSISVSMALVTNRTHIDMTTPPSSSSSSSSLRHKNHRSRKQQQQHVQSLPLSSQKRKQYKHDIKHLYHHSRHLRSAAVDILSRNPRKLLFLQGNEYLRAKDLVSAAAAQYGMTGKEYCEQMRKDSYWGGGPEIVALCNFLRRPIHVYELCCDDDDDDNGDEEVDMEMEEDCVENFQSGGSSKNGMDVADTKDAKTRKSSRRSSFHRPSEYNTQFQLRRMACFGSPKFDRREALHILSADSRFPDIESGKQLASGNHFLALFPEELIQSVMEEGEEKFRRKQEMKERRLQRADLRGGDAHAHLDHGIGGFYDDVSFWSNGILKYVKIDFIWQFVHRLKLAFL